MLEILKNSQASFLERSASTPRLSDETLDLFTSTPEHSALNEEHFASFIEHSATTPGHSTWPSEHFASTDQNTATLQNSNLPTEISEEVSVSSAPAFRYHITKVRSDSIAVIEWRVAEPQI